MKLRTGSSKKSKNIDIPLDNLKEMHTHKHTEKGDQIKKTKNKKRDYK